MLWLLQKMDVKYFENGFFRLNDAIKCVKSRFYPFFGSKKCYKNSLYLGIGGNVGNVKQNFDKIFRILSNDKRFHVVETSPIVLNRAFGYKNQPNFLNAVVLIQTNLPSRAVLKNTLRIEQKFGRKRSFKNAPRTIDIDILFSNVKNRNDKFLTLPHIGINERISVILPFGLMR